MSKLRPWLLRVWRLLAVIGAAVLLHVAAGRQEQQRPATISIEQAQRLFPTAARVASSLHEHGPDEVFDASGRRLGFVARTSPQSDSIIGYSGPNNVLVGLSPSGRVIGMHLLSSGDTPAHVADVEKSQRFWRQFVGWSPSHESAPHIEAVSGSTLTSLGIAEAVQKRLAGRVESLRFPEAVTLEEVRAFFPEAHACEPDRPRPGWHRVTRGDAVLGFVVRTSPFSDFARGHSGPTESLVAVAPDAKTLLAVRLRRSYDTEDYVDSVREDDDYLRQLASLSTEQWTRIDLKAAGFEGVSGATETSFAVAEGIRRRFASEATLPANSSTPFKTRDWALLGIVAGSVLMSFSGLRGKAAVRLVWQAALIGVFGLWYGDLLSLALLAGWARNGVSWQIAPSLVILAAMALLLPWATRRQVYCHHLCPHGAAQEWLGRFPKLHYRLSPRLENPLRRLPGILLALAFAAAVVLPQFDLAQLEPFDAWSMRGAVLAATLIALIGLAASLFVPMAYCRFGCPTGTLLKFLRSTGSSDRFGARDAAALLLLMAGTVFVFWPQGRAAAPPAPAPTVEVSGSAFGTTWSVKLRDAAAASDTNALRETLSAELQRIETLLSHWRPGSATSRFNAARTTHAVEVPEELVEIVARGLELSRASGGAFDITVAPLVRAWGFGPGDAPVSAPDPAELARLRSITGWQKLHANLRDSTLQKGHPELEIDLGALLQGYAVDRLAYLLDEKGVASYLIEVGGELRARGRWRVAIEHPLNPEKPLRSIVLEDAALATSGTYRAAREDGKKRWSHMIDPATGEPVRHGTILVSVLHPSCAVADAWATALLLAGDDRAAALAKANELSALIASHRAVIPANFPREADAP